MPSVDETWPEPKQEAPEIAEVTRALREREEAAARIQGLLEANNALLERARAAEKRVREMTVAQAVLEERLEQALRTCTKTQELP